MNEGETAAIPRALSENSSWNQNNASNIIFDANVELDSSNTPRAEPPKAHWHPHQQVSEGVTISPQLSQKDGFIAISRQVSFKIDEVNISSKQNSSTTPPSSSPPSVVIKKSRTLSFLRQSSGSKSNDFSEEKDLFEVEKQLKGLHHSINASKQTEHNAFIHSKPLFLRLFSCSTLLTQPASRSMDQIHNSAKSWDLFFQRKGNQFEGEVLSEDVLRGVKSTLDGKYMPKSCHLKLWSHVGIVIALSAQTTPKPSPRGGSVPSVVPVPSRPLSLTAEEPPKTRKTFLSRVTPQREVKTKYLLIANERGLSLRNFQEVLSTCDLIIRGSLPTGRYVAAYRPIRVTKLGVPQYCLMCEYLEKFAKLAQANGGLLLWRDLFIAHQHILLASSSVTSPPIHSPPDQETPSPTVLPPLPLSLSSTPLTSLSFLSTFFTRLSLVSHRPSNESIAEAIRCFHLIATSHLSEADFTDLNRKSQGGGSSKGGLRSKSQFEVISVQSLREGLRGILRLPLPSSVVAGASETKKEADGVGEAPAAKIEGGSRVNAESSHQLERLLTAFEADNAADGMISLVYPPLSLCYLTPLSPG
jgi:hypothetical protein